MPAGLGHVRDTGREGCGVGGEQDFLLRGREQ